MSVNILLVKCVQCADTVASYGSLRPACVNCVVPFSLAKSADNISQSVNADGAAGTICYQRMLLEHVIACEKVVVRKSLAGGGREVGLVLSSVSLPPLHSQRLYNRPLLPSSPLPPAASTPKPLHSTPPVSVKGQRGGGFSPLP